MEILLQKARICKNNEKRHKLLCCWASLAKRWIVFFGPIQVDIRVCVPWTNKNTQNLCERPGKEPGQISSIKSNVRQALPRFWKKCEADQGTLFITTVKGMSSTTMQLEDFLAIFINIQYLQYRDIWRPLKIDVTMLLTHQAFTGKNHSDGRNWPLPTSFSCWKYYNTTTSSAHILQNHTSSGQYTIQSQIPQIYLQHPSTSYTTASNSQLRRPP